MSPRALAVLISGVVLVALVFGMVVFAGEPNRPTREDPRSRLPRFPTPVDHGAFFDAPLPDGPSVTRRCLECHPAAASEVMGTTHWTWSGPHRAGEPGGTADVGKRREINNFCIGVAANWPRCTSCHAGYGWRDDSFLETAGPDRVDCLVCHDTSGLYEKDPVGAGLPGKDVDLLASARSVGRSSRTTCGACHFKGGGGDGVKHGDLDETMAFPSPTVDVHMGRHALRCADCHRTEHHRIRGRLLPAAADPAERVTCEDCHDAAPHDDARLDAHVAAVACQTCHIPTYAAEHETKLWWDWSKAGRDGPPEQVAERVRAEVLGGGAGARGYPVLLLGALRQVGTDPDLRVHYDKNKGFFLLARRQVPEYRWYDGTTSRHRPGERLPGPATASAVPLNAPRGDVRDPVARIWPFKVHRGIQPSDAEHRHLLVPHTFGKEGYWSHYDWERALQSGARASGIPYSGAFTWTTTEMFWPQNHMVRPASEALRCTDCHGDGGRMDWSALGYAGDPARRGGRRAAGLLGAPSLPGRAR